MPLAWLGLGVALGLLWGAAHPLPWATVVVWLVALGGSYALARGASLRVGALTLLLVGALLGVLRADGTVLNAGDVFQADIGNSVAVTGTVNGVVEEVGAQMRFTLDVSRMDGEDVLGKAIAWANPNMAPIAGRNFPYLQHGDVVELRGTVEAPQPIGAFDYPEHLSAQGIGAVIQVQQITGAWAGGAPFYQRWLEVLRAKLAEAIRRHVPEPQASVVNALVLGLRGGIPPAVNDDFRQSGLSHLLAVSGLHVGVLLFLVLGASARVIGRNHVVYLLPPLLLLWLYVLLAGAPPSAVRAGLMGTAFLLSLATGRSAVPINALGLTAFILLLGGPSTLWDRGFQLSAAAMAGVLFIGLPLAQWAFERGAAHGRLTAIAYSYALAPVAVSAGAIIGSAPLVAYNFGQVPLLSIPATLLALPLLPPLLVSSFLAGVGALVWAPLGAVLGAVPALLGWLLVGLARTTATLPFAAVDVNVSVSWVWSAYGALVLIAAIVYHKQWLPSAVEVAQRFWKGPERKLTTVLVVVGLASLAAVPWSVVALRHGDGMLHAYFFDVGDGDAALIVTPDGGTVLIDGGRDPRQTISAVDSVLGGRVNLDVAVITNPNANHANGVIELARRGRVSNLLLGPSVNAAGDAEWAELTPIANLTEVWQGARIEVGDGTTIEILNPSLPPLLGTGADENNNSVSLLVSWEHASVLFTSELEAAGERSLMSNGANVDADVLQVAHHGSNSSSVPEFVNAVSPEAAVISVGANNPYGYPSQTVVGRIEGLVGDSLFMTSRDGTIELASDGARWFSKH